MADGDGDAARRDEGAEQGAAGGTGTEFFFVFVVLVMLVAGWLLASLSIVPFVAKRKGGIRGVVAAGRAPVFADRGTARARGTARPCSPSGSPTHRAPSRSITPKNRRATAL